NASGWIGFPPERRSRRHPPSAQHRRQGRGIEGRIRAIANEGFERAAKSRSVSRAGHGAEQPGRHFEAEQLHVLEEWRHPSASSLEPASKGGGGLRWYSPVSQRRLAFAARPHAFSATTSPSSPSSLRLRH